MAVLLHFVAKFIVLFGILICLSLSCNSGSDVKETEPDSSLTVCYTVSPEWVFKGKNKSSSYVFQSEKPVFTGSMVEFGFHDTLSVESFILEPALALDKSKIITYKIYLNNIYAGKYQTGQAIKPPACIYDLKLIIQKTGNEQIIHAWDEDFYYTRIKDSSENGVPELSLKIKLNNRVSYRFVDLQEKKVFQDSKTFQWSAIAGDNELRPVVMIRKSRRVKTSEEQIFNFSSNGEMIIHCIKGKEETRKIETDLFIRNAFVGHFNDSIAKYNKFKAEIQGKMQNRTIGVEAQFVWKNNSNSFKIKSEHLDKEFFIDFPDKALVDIVKLDKSILVDIPYASENNISGVKLYSCNKCFLRYVVAKSLLEAKLIFASKVLNIKMLDCYRPLDVQKILYEKFPVKGYVADPIGGSIHNRGTAVDLTLVDKSGSQMDMGSEYDDFSVKSHVSYQNLPDTTLKLRQFLHETMKACNFVPIRMEWWHFEYSEARKYPKLNDPFPCNED